MGLVTFNATIVLGNYVVIIVFVDCIYNVLLFEVLYYWHIVQVIL